MEKSSKVFVGMDVHKGSIEVTLAEEVGERVFVTTRRGPAGSGSTANSRRSVSAACMTAIAQPR